ncbi:MAG: hypothetical protein LUF85_04410 [Bacteroides sp.]|nr:hypothetical protein [Bacteroides sp.]
MATTFNSNEYAWVDVRVALLGREVTGLRGIEYKVKHQKEALYATGKKARSIQKGKKEYEGTITLLQSELIALDRAAQEKNYEDITDIDFDVVVTYISEDNVVTTDKIVNASITEIPRGIKEGDLQQEIALTFIALDVESNVA